MTRSSRHSGRSRCGITLVEVLAGTVILGTLLASSIVAAGRLEAQSARSELRVEACRVADQLLETWWTDRSEIPRSDSGLTGVDQQWRWRTCIVDSDAGQEFGAEVVALEVFPADGAHCDALARVELLLGKETQ